VGGGAGRATGATGGQGGEGGVGARPSTGGTGASLPPGVPLTPVDGRVEDSSNALGIQGDIFAFADSTTAVGMTENFATSNACISGTAAKVDLACTPVPPAVDCYGTTWGAAIGFNLNQPIDPFTMLGVIPPLEYDASALRGFAFELSGSNVPTQLRFRVDTPTQEYCSPITKLLMPGANTLTFSDLRTECWTVGGESGEAAKPNVVRIAWQVVTSSSSVVPFDFCVSNIRAVQ